MMAPDDVRPDDALIPSIDGDAPRGLYVADSGRRAALLHEAETLPSLLLNSAAAANAVMLGSGYFHPLPGYMDAADALAVATQLRTCAGQFWPVPCLNLCATPPEVKPGARLALRDPNLSAHPVLAVQQVAAVELLEEQQLASIAAKVYGTVERTHPGVDNFLAQGAYAISGPIEVLNYSYFATEFPGTFRTAQQLRAAFRQRGWRRVVAFQTRNPMHRAHEELCKTAMRETGADGLLIHMVLGRLKQGDIPATVRGRRHTQDGGVILPRRKRADRRLRLRYALRRPTRGAAARRVSSECRLQPPYHRARPCRCGGLLRAVRGTGNLRSGPAGTRWRSTSSRQIIPPGRGAWEKW